MRTPILHASLALLISVLLASVASAQIYLELQGVPGDVTAPRYEGQIALKSFSNELEPGLCVSMSFTKDFDRSSPLLAASVFFGQVYPKATVRFLRPTPAGTLEEYVVVRLSNLQILKIGSSGDGESPLEEDLELAVDRFEVGYEGPRGVVSTGVIDCIKLKGKAL